MLVDRFGSGAGDTGVMCTGNGDGGIGTGSRARAAGEKFRIHGGWRFNFAEMAWSLNAFSSNDPHFAKSALARYTQWDFVELIDQHGIKWHEKTLGQLFCDVSAKEIVAMLCKLMQDAGVELQLQTSVNDLIKTESGYSAVLTGPNSSKKIIAKNLVVATGGKSIP